MRFEAKTAMWALGKMGSEAASAVPVITELLNDKNERVRKAAAEALGKIKMGSEQGNNPSK
jgi:HEAT repeat protein